MIVYYMSVYKDNKTTAGAKAPDDISKIARTLGYRELVFKSAFKFRNIKLTRFFAMFVGIRNWIYLLCKVCKGAYVIIQHPNENIIIGNMIINLVKKVKKIKFIFLIHDLESIRKSLLKGNSQFLEERGVIADEVLLKKADYIICHNKSMKKYLLLHGFDNQKLVELEIFDYLHDCKLSLNRKKDNSIIIAGNLLKEKAGYVYKLIEKDIIQYKINLFGPNYTGPKDKDNIYYYGECLPDQLPEKLKGAFGLVWDGTELNGCHGKAGEYIKYNNPHKCSLFLASGIPVIIWKEAALADFVKENGVGILVESLDDILEKICHITDDEYAQLVVNTNKIGTKLRDGFYFKKALKDIFDREK